MKKLIIALALLCSTAQAADHTFYTSEQVGEGMKSHFSEVDNVERRIMRRAELQNDVSLANLKIAAFEVEVAKAKLEKSVAQAALERLTNEK